MEPLRQNQKLISICLRESPQIENRIYLQSRIDNFLHRAQISVVQNLRLLPHGKNTRGGHRIEDFRDLQKQTFISLESGLGPINDLGKRQAPTIGKEDRNTSGT